MLPFLSTINILIIIFFMGLRFMQEGQQTVRTYRIKVAEIAKSEILTESFSLQKRVKENVNIIKE